MLRNSNENASRLAQSIENLATRIVNEKLKNEVRTTVPGYILSFDPVKQRASVQVGVEKLLISGESVSPPPIIQCPVCIYGASGGAIEVEVSKGDECLIHFSMRCIDGWREQGGIAPLVRIERFRESDAFVVLAPRSSANAITSYSNDGIKIRSKDGSNYVWVKSNGEVEINGAKVTSSGNVITAAGTDLDAFKAEYDLHTHSHGDPSGTTSTPL